MRKYWKDLLAIGVILAVIWSFFLPLFWPEPKLLVTPDFGKSDAWHSGFASKYLLWENLQNKTIPLWTDTIGAGFPMLAETEIGTFFLPNLIFYGLISDPVIAHNLATVFTIIILATGFYVWLRNLSLTVASSIFGSLTFTLSGIVILQLPHVAVLQAFSLLGWIMAWTAKLNTYRTGRFLVLGAIIFSQQFFAGFPQASFITLLFAASFVVWHVWQAKWRATSLIFFICAVLLGIGLSAIQLIPSYEILKETSHPGGLPSSTSSYFSFPLKHLLSFLNPFALGDPRLGTYPHFIQFDGSIFWENTGYIGLLPFAFILMAIAKKTASVRFFLFSLVISFLLMWGSHSPLYIVFSFWPFNLFRVPSRFLWIFVFSLVSIASIGMNAIFHVSRKRLFHVVAIILVLINSAFLFMLWKDYHLLVPAADWMNPPPIVSLIPGGSRIYTLGSEAKHNSVFLSSGWQDSKVYAGLREALTPNSNVLWQIASYEAFFSRQLNRTTIVDSLLDSHIQVTDQEVVISTVASSLLDLSSVTHLISSVPVQQESLIQKPVIYDQKTADVAIWLFANPTAVPRAYFAQTTIVVETVEEAQRTLVDEKFKVGKTVLVEDQLDLESYQGKGTAQILITEPRRVVIQSSTPQRALLVLNDTYYPGWLAMIDGISEPIFPVNIRFRGVVVPEGEHIVEFRYQPRSYRIGIAVSTFFLLITGVLVAFPNFFGVFHIRQKGLSHAARPPDNHGMLKPRKKSTTARS